MAIQISGTTVVNNSRQLQNIASVDATTAATIAAAGPAAGTAFLGSVSAGTGSSCTLSSLNLSSYKWLRIEGHAIRQSGYSKYVMVNNNPSNSDPYEGAFMLTVNSRDVYGSVDVNLTTGHGFTFWSGVHATGSNFPQSRNNFTNLTQGQGGVINGVTTSATSITMYAHSGESFSQGTFRFYGIG